MNYLDLTLPTPAENLACDEALLDLCDASGSLEILRIWESTNYFVVVGYANKVDLEVDRQKCGDKEIPILRRCSGGGTVVQGPGCLNYSLTFRVAENQSLQTITQTNRFVMERHRKIFQNYLGKNVSIHGHTDLAINTSDAVLKFSGNAQRRKKNAVLFHGTFLLDFDLALIEAVLKMPSVQPNYRESRSHEKFLINLQRPASEIKNLLQEGWNASTPLESIPDLTKLLREQYCRDDWNLKF